MSRAAKLSKVGLMRPVGRELAIPALDFRKTLVNRQYKKYTLYICGQVKRN
jgi:hypothetical protein